MRARHVPLAMVPVALAAPWLGLGPSATFAAAAFGLAALDGLVGDAIDACAIHAGPRVGGLLNAVLGCATHGIIAAVALDAGWLGLVKASLTGAILAHLVLTLGLSIFLGGVRHGTQYFHRERANIATTMMVLSAIALGVPTFYGQLVPVRNTGPVESLSEAVAVVMLCVYLLSRYYALAAIDVPASRYGAVPPTRWSRPLALALLGVALAGIVALAIVLVGTLEPVMRRFDVNALFVGMVVVPLVGNVATSHIAVRAAWRNRMDLSLDISTDASMQTALFVAPLLVFASLALGRPMDLVFNPVELGAMAAAAAVASLVAADGESNWLEGVMLMAVYLLIGLAFFWWPAF